MGNHVQAKTHPTELLIREARKLLKPTEVKLHKVPGWFRKQLLKTTGCSHGLTAGWSVLQHAIDKADAHMLFDHCGSTVLSTGTPAFVAEPYGGDVRQVTKAIRFAELTGLDVHISANSWWYPGQTVRFEFTLKEKAEHE